RLLDQRGAAAAVLLRPRQPGVARVGQLSLPVLAELERRLVAGRLGAGMVLVEPAAQLVAKGLLLRRQRQVHGRAHATGRPNRPLPEVRARRLDGCGSPARPGAPAQPWDRTACRSGAPARGAPPRASSPPCTAGR